MRFLDSHFIRIPHDAVYYILYIDNDHQEDVPHIKNVHLSFIRGPFQWAIKLHRLDNRSDFQLLPTLLSIDRLVSSS